MKTANPKTVCMGGGTGLPQLLAGLKQQSRASGRTNFISLDDVTVVVTVFDDGGSSGRIIEAYKTLPPGDLRNCLLVLADEQSEPLMTRFFNHRFGDDEHETLAGHSAGNLLLLSLAQIHGGDIRKAILSIRKILPIQGTILFPTASPAILCARLTDGTVIKGESQIARRKTRAPISEIFLEHRSPAPATEGFPPMEGVLEAILSADIITLGPGSLYTSVLPHFLVDGVAEAFRCSTARKIFVSNLMNEVGETDGFGISDHVLTLERVAGIRIDAVIANDSPVSEELLRAYHRERSEFQFNKLKRRLERAFERAMEDKEEALALEKVAEMSCTRLVSLARDLRQPGGSLVQVLPNPADAIPSRIRVITRDLLADVEVAGHGGQGSKRVIRHDPLKLAEAILETADLPLRTDGTP